MFFTHRSVLLDQAVNALVWTPDGVYVDGTFGRGGHSKLILNKLSLKGRLFAIDKDPAAIEFAKSWIDNRFFAENGNFSDLDLILKKHACKQLSGLLLDLGVSSPQLDDPKRGFSFRCNGPLDMRMDPSRGLTAADWLDQASEQEIKDVILFYGEDRCAAKIAKAIILRRQDLAQRGRRIEGTMELAEIVAKVTRRRGTRRHPATKTFQAIRIHINQELNDLEKVLKSCINLLVPGGRLVVLSFHSLEDRIVKNFIKENSNHALCLLRCLGKFRVGNEEKIINVRSRSAIMRVAEKK